MKQMKQLTSEDKNILNLLATNDHRNTRIAFEICKQALKGEYSEYVARALREFPRFCAEYLVENENVKKIKVQVTNPDYLHLIGHLPNVEDVHLEGHLLQQLPKEFANLKHLKKLRLHACGFQHFPEEVLDIMGLEELAITKSDIYQIPEEISNLQELVRLHLIASPLSSIPYNIRTLKKLSLLDLRNLDILDFGDCFDYLENLEHLYLVNPGDEGFGNKLFPVGAERLPLLNTLMMRDAKLQKLPELDLPKLEVLDLGFNNIQRLPTSIGNLMNLRELGLEGNKIKGFPPELGQLGKLEVLDVSGNQLPYLPASHIQQMLYGFHFPKMKVATFGKEWKHYEGVIRRMVPGSCRVNFVDNCLAMFYS